MAHMEKWQCVKWLVEHRYSVNTPDSLGRTALWYACATSSISLIKTLLDAGADINRAETFDKELTPLGITITAERYVVLEYLLRRKRHTRKTLNDALYIAAEGGFDKSILMLYKAGANPIIPNMGDYPIIAAAWSAKYSTVKLLIQLGCNPYQKDKDGYMVTTAWRGFEDISALVKQYRQKKRVKMPQKLKSVPTVTKR